MQEHSTKKIYDIQATHQMGIDKLEQQLADAKAKEMQEIVATLTDGQKKQLAVIEEAAKAKAQEDLRLRREKQAKEKADAAKEKAPVTKTDAPATKK